MSALPITDMAPDHIAAVIEIDRLCYPDPWDELAWIREFDAPNRCHLVATIADHVVGHAGSLQIVDQLHVATVAVHPSHEGTGIATRLVLQLLNRGLTTGATASTLEVRAGAKRAQRVYSRVGFGPVAVRSNYYSNPTEDAVIMWLDDLASDPVQDRLLRVAAEFDVVASGGSV